MQKKFLSLMITGLFLLTCHTGFSQQTQKEARTVEMKRKTDKNPEVAKLKEGVNKKSNVKTDETIKKNGPVYGENYCDVVVDNYTNLYVKIWIDGNYKGIVEPYGKRTVYAVPGKTKMYCRADFDDGSYSYWGPDYFDCDYEFTIKLR